MERYETIPQQVEAWQAPMDLEIPFATDIYSARDGASPRRMVKEGEWVVKHSNGKYEVIPDNLFVTKYRKVPTVAVREPEPPVRPRVMWPDTDTSAPPVGGYRPYKNGDITFTTNVSVPDFGRTLPVRYAPMTGGQ